jgi:type III secretion protein W
MKIDTPMHTRASAAIAQAATVHTNVAKQVVGSGVQSGSMEEVGMTFSHHVERSSKSLRQRQIRSARSDHGRLKPESRAQLEEWFDRIGHPDQKGLGDLASHTGTLLQRQPLVEELVEITGGDPVRTDIVLQETLRAAEVLGQRLEAKRARDYLQMLRERYGDEIQAGMNIAQALRNAGGDPALRQAVRRLYYDTVVLKQSLPSMMQSLLGLFGEREFVPGLGMMRRALADDIAAETPSKPTAKLRTLLIGLNTSTQLGGLLQGCRGLLERLASSCPVAQLTAVNLLQRLLGFAAGGLNPVEVRRIGRELGGEEERDQLISLNALYPLLKQVPLALWRDGKSRQAALKNLLVLLDTRSQGERRGQTAEPVVRSHA